MTNLTRLDINPPDPDVIAKLEKWLDSAKRGDIRAVFLVGIPQGGGHWKAWVGDYTPAEMVYAAELAKDAIKGEALEAEESIEIDDPEE